MLPAVLKMAKNDPAFANLRTDRNRPLDNIISAFDNIGDLCSLCYTSEISSNFDKFVELLEEKVEGTILALNRLDHTVIPVARRRRNQADTNEAVTFGDIISREDNEENDANAVDNEQVNGPTVAYKKSGGPLCNRLKTHLLIHLVEDCKRFASPVHLATERNEQYNKNIRAVVVKTNKQNPSRDLALITGREVMLRTVAMGSYWNNGTSIAGPLVKEWFERFGEPMFFNNNREYGMSEYISGKKVVANMVAIFELNSGSSNARRILAKVLKKQKDNVHIQLFNLVNRPGFRVYEDNNLTEEFFIYDQGNPLTQPTSEAFVVKEEELTLVELLDMSHTTVINGTEYHYINRHKFGTLWWLANTNRSFKRIEG